MHGVSEKNEEAPQGSSMKSKPTSGGQFFPPSDPDAFGRHLAREIYDAYTQEVAAHQD